MNSDLKHLKEYEAYLERLTIMDLLNLTPQEQEWRLERIVATERMAEQMRSKLGNT